MSEEKPITFFMCTRGQRAENPKKFKCTKCKTYFKSTEEYKKHECPIELLPEEG